MATKNAKTFDTWFFPVNPAYLDIFTLWMIHLKEGLFFGPEDPLFPKQKIANIGRTFVSDGLLREPYRGSAELNTIIKRSFQLVDMPGYSPHSFRITLATYGDTICSSMQELKAWSLNLGHERLAPTANSYISVSREQQREFIKSAHRTRESPEVFTNSE